MNWKDNAWMCMSVAARPFSDTQRAEWIKDQTEHCKPRKQADTRTEDEIRAFEASKEAAKLARETRAKTCDPAYFRGKSIPAVESELLAFEHLMNASTGLDNWIARIKRIRELTEWGLKESKEFYERNFMAKYGR